MMRPGKGELGLYVRTVSHLRPAQIAYRVRLRAQQEALRRRPALFDRRWLHQGGECEWPSTFSALDAALPPDCGTIDELEQGSFRFLNETRALGSPLVWDPADASQLWLYHQHYWEWSWTLLAHPDRDRSRRIFADQVRLWIDQTQFGRWNAWAPYPTSLRSWVFVNVAEGLVHGSSLEDEFTLLLRQHAGFVERNLELDVGGNHLVKNLKALTGLGVYFGDDRLIDKAATHLERQLAVQVLADGGHFELSPSYHCQVLGDLIDVQGLLGCSSGGRHLGALDDAVAKMRRWLGVMRMPDGDVPLFNDCERVGLDRIELLEPTPRPSDVLTVLRESGYVVARPSPDVHLVADVGDPCPPDLPAHAQADCLTFELAIDGRRVVVDPGTSEYGSGPQRRWERSTAAHNTVTIDGTDQTEVWGAFRAGRLAKAVLNDAHETEGTIVVVAHHDGYEGLDGAPVHQRRWDVGRDGITITDTVRGQGKHEVLVRLLLDAVDVEQVDRGLVEASVHQLRIHVLANGRPAHVDVAPANFAVRHGEFSPGAAVEHRSTHSLPARIITRIERR